MQPGLSPTTEEPPGNRPSIYSRGGNIRQNVAAVLIVATSISAGQDEDR